MKNYLRTILAMILSFGLLTACSSNEVQTTGSKSKTDLYLLYRMQESSISMYERSEIKRESINEALLTEPDAAKKKRLSQLMTMGEHFDAALEKLIHKIETAKLEIVTQTGVSLDNSETIKYIPKSIISRYYFMDADPNKNISVDFDFAEFGKEQHKLMLEFRKHALSALLDNSIGSDNKQFTFQDPNILLENGSTEEFLKSVEKSFGKMKINYDDAQVSKMIYIMATPNTSFYRETFQDNIHWIEKFRLLEDQKQKLLEIRQFFYSQLSSKVNLAQMVDFNSIVAVTEGNESVAGGSEQTFKVFMAGVNTLNQPIINMSAPNSGIDIKNGVANIKVSVPKGASEVVYAGTISITDKTGKLIQRNWSKKFVIRK